MIPGENKDLYLGGHGQLYLLIRHKESKTPYRFPRHLRSQIPDGFEYDAEADDENGELKWRFWTMRRLVPRKDMKHVATFGPGNKIVGMEVFNRSLFLATESQVYTVRDGKLEPVELEIESEEDPDKKEKSSC